MQRSFLFLCLTHITHALTLQVGNPTRKLCLVKLADNANDFGECFPSVAYLASVCECSVRTVQYHLAELEAMGLITSQKRVHPSNGQMSNLYTLTLEKGQKVTLPPRLNLTNAKKAMVESVSRFGGQKAVKSDEPKKIYPMQNLHTPPANSARPPVQNLHPNLSDITCQNNLPPPTPRGGVERLPVVTLAVDDEKANENTNASVNASVGGKVESVQAVRDGINSAKSVRLALGRQGGSQADIDTAVRVLEYLSDRVADLAKSLGEPEPLRYQAVVGNLRPICRSLCDYSEQDCLRVVDFLVASWGFEPSMRVHLTPHTVFKGSTFGGYVVQSQIWVNGGRKVRGYGKWWDNVEQVRKRAQMPSVADVRTWVFKMASQGKKAFKGLDLSVTRNKILFYTVMEVRRQNPLERDLQRVMEQALEQVVAKVDSLAVPVVE